MKKVEYWDVEIERIETCTEVSDFPVTCYRNTQATQEIADTLRWGGTACS